MKEKEKRTFVISKVSKLKIKTLIGNYEISKIDHDKIICVLMAWTSMKMSRGLIMKEMWGLPLSKVEHTKSKNRMGTHNR